MEPNNNYPYFPPHYTESSNNNDLHSLQLISQEKEKRNSLLLITEPKDLVKLFDTARSLERDICYPPNNNGRPSTSSTMHDARIEDELKITSRHSSSSSSFDGVDLSALSLFSTIHSPTHSPQPKHYYGNEESKKLFSLYGDNSRNTVHHHDNSKQFPMLQQRQEDRFIYYHLDTGCIKGKSLSELKSPHLTIEDLLLKENYWIDITCPSNEEMKAISKVRSKKGCK